MIHLEVRKVRRMPDGGGWHVHGRGSTAAKAAKPGPGAKIGYTYLHSAANCFSRLAYIESLEDEKAVTTIGFFCGARAFFAAHCINRLHRVMTDNGVNYRAKDFTRGVLARGRPAPAHQALHAAAQREGGAVQPAAGQRGALRPALRQRAGPPRRHRALCESLQLPSAPYRLQRSASGLTRPGPCE